jgi:hypothetical protein
VTSAIVIRRRTRAREQAERLQSAISTYVSVEVERAAQMMLQADRFDVPPIPIEEFAKQWLESSNEGSDNSG